MGDSCPAETCGLSLKFEWALATILLCFGNVGYHSIAQSILTDLVFTFSRCIIKLSQLWKWKTDAAWLNEKRHNWTSGQKLKSNLRHELCQVTRDGCQGCSLRKDNNLVKTSEVWNLIHALHPGLWLCPTAASLTNSLRSALCESWTPELRSHLLFRWHMNHHLTSLKLPFLFLKYEQNFHHFGC